MINDLVYALNIRISETGSLGIGSVTNESKVRFVITNAGASNEVRVRARINNEQTWVDLVTYTGNANEDLDVFTWDQLEVIVDTYDSIGSWVSIVASSFDAGLISIITPDGDIINASSLNFTSSDNSVTISADQITSTIDLIAVGGGGGAVSSVFTRTGAVVAQSGDYTKAQVGLSDVDNTSDIDKPVSTAQQTALDLKRDVNMNETYSPNAGAGLFTMDSDYMRVDPIANSPSETYNMESKFIEFDVNQDGFSLGVGGQAASITNMNFKHVGMSDLGSLSFITTNSDLGNGTDAIEIGGIGHIFGFTNIDSSVTITGPLQGYGYQVNMASGSIMNSYLNAFYDFSNIDTACGAYQSFACGPIISSIKNNNSYSAFSCNTQIPTFTGNAGFTGLGVNPTLGTFDTGNFQGININPTISSVGYATGINVSMDNVTVYPGTQSDLVFQDLTFEFISPGDNNAYTMEYTSGGTAGSEVVTVLGQAISVQIENGVSTATQIKVALEANITFNTNVTATISGVGSNPQVTAGPTNFVNGTFPGNKQAAYLDGDVEVTGALTFGGALSIGQLNAFYASNPVDGGGNPQGMHGLITGMTALNGVTVANGDAIGVNTAMLITLEDNSVTTSGPFGLGFAALALPCVVETHTGSSLDFMTAAAYALNLSGSSTGGTIDTVKLCRGVVVPNGITTINKLRGFQYDAPFGNVATVTHAFYTAEDVENYFKKSLVIGEATEVAANSSVGLEISSVTKALLNARMTTTERDALTALNGMQIYNTTTDKLQVYAAGSWVDLH